MDKIVIKMVERISKKRHESLIPLFRKCLFCMDRTSIFNPLQVKNRVANFNKT